MQTKNYVNSLRIYVCRECFGHNFRGKVRHWTRESCAKRNRTRIYHQSRTTWLTAGDVRARNLVTCESRENAFLFVGNAQAKWMAATALGPRVLLPLPGRLCTSSPLYARSDPAISMFTLWFRITGCGLLSYVAGTSLRGKRCLQSGQPTKLLFESCQIYTEYILTATRGPRKY